MTVRVRFRRLYGHLQDGFGMIFYHLAGEGESKRILTDIRLHAWQWDAQNECVVLQGGRFDDMLLRIQERIDRDVSRIGQICQLLESGKPSFHLSEVGALFAPYSRRMSFLWYFVQQIVALQAGERFGTARNYQRALDSFCCFLRGKDISFGDFTAGVVNAYDAWLSDRRVVRNTKSFYMRILRSVYNKAVRQGLARQKFPFSEVYTGVDQTCKRAVSEECLLRLYRLDLIASPMLCLARDIFLFSYYARGMSFVDIAYLKKASIKEGRMQYVRRKTGQTIEVRIEPCMQEIIDRYTALCRHTPYVFPYVTEEDSALSFRQYQSALGDYNRQLKRLGSMIGLERPLSSYSARHAWATAARDHNVPLTVISAGMGHTSEKTTRIYLAALENSVIDQANKMLLEVFAVRQCPVRQV